MSVKEAVEIVSKGGFLATLLNKMYGQIVVRDDANDLYVVLHQAGDNYLEQGMSYNSPEMQSIVEALSKLPAYGACRDNFKKLYLRDEYTFRRLPDDPRRIPKGHWH